MNYVKMTCIFITTPITSNIKLPQFYPEIENRVFSPVVLGDDREKGLGQDRIAEPSDPIYLVHGRYDHRIRRR